MNVSLIDAFFSVLSEKLRTFFDIDDVQWKKFQSSSHKGEFAGIVQEAVAYTRQSRFGYQRFEAHD